VLESQFRNYFVLAERQTGMTGENLLRILESRLDNVVYRAGFAMSRAEARQLVLHRHFTVNGQIVNIASFLCKAGDVVELRTRECEKIKESVEKNASHPTPVWMTADKDNYKATITRLPDRAEIDFDVAEHLIVELYSK
ncbi:MAG: 30S ribosomal protein S4, partial [Evtepia sp.]